MSFIGELIDAIKFLFAYICKKSFCDYRPFVIVLEATNNCNLKCIMCAHPNMKREKGYMSLDLFKSIINTNKNFIRRLDLHMLGEPLLHNDISMMVKYAKDNNVRTKYKSIQSC